jgi:hypothetical protein
MARYHGIVGYGNSVKTGVDIFEDEIIEIEYYGDMRKQARRIADGESVSDELTLNHTISIVADEYANNHYHAIKFAEVAGTAWTVDSVEVISPRLLLTLGKVYNGPRA